MHMKLRHFDDDRKNQLLEISLPILEGLLASGHFTGHISYGEWIAHEGLLYRDNGADWKESGAYTNRMSCRAIEQALRLASKLVAEINFDYKLRDERMYAHMKSPAKANPQPHPQR